ncbi:hypothetical protein [Olleya sp.]|jgi:hypothetical protein|uniref:hypothetical protein n=1 Tax=Olleya sp. TaxID=1906788 RepID=UPI0032D93E25
MNKYVQIVLIIICITSCKTISVNQERQQITTQNIMLGAVGNQKKFMLEQDYNHVAFPVYSLPIKIQPNLITFNKQSFNTFKKAQLVQNKTIFIKYVDSIKTKQSTFLKLEIADRVGILKALHNKDNSEVFQFIKNNNQTHITTSISIALNQDHQTAIIQADEVFLESSGVKNFVLKTYINTQLQEIIKFTDGVVFAYQTSNACWKEDRKYQLQIIDLVESNDKCPSKSYQSSKRAKKKINYYNF